MLLSILQLTTMDLSSQTTKSAILPTAAFSKTHSNYNDENTENSEPHWENSILNPKNRIESLSPLPNPLWRIDAVASNGTDFFIVPLFMENFPYLRIGLSIPEHTKFCRRLQEDLMMSAVFHMRDKARINNLPLTQHLLRILQHWTLSNPNFDKIYQKLPWGSSLVAENIPNDVKCAKLTITPSHHAEQQLLTVEDLQLFWGHELDLPEPVDIKDLRYEEQLHDSVCVVWISHKRYAFKAVTTHTKYLYNELRQLLLITPHDNIISRPRHLIVKPSVFGGELLVIGFTLEYHKLSCARDHLGFYRRQNISSLRREVNWCLQITSALIHLRETRGTYYPDLRLDNILLTDNLDFVMVDFEQRGVWFEYAPPEVNAIDIMCTLQGDSSLDERIRSKYRSILESVIPNADILLQANEYYYYTNDGFNIPWLALTSKEREAGEVFMLGRLMWCIFEAACAPHSGSYWVSYAHELGFDFPVYSATPPAIRNLIDWCTRGHRQCLSDVIFRQDGKMILREHQGTSSSTPQQVKEAAYSFWEKEVQDAEEWVSERSRQIQAGTWNENYYHRPNLRQVHRELVKFRESELGMD